VPSIPLTPEEERHVQNVIGIQSTDDLFSSIAPKLRESADFKLNLGPDHDGTGRGMSEHELRHFFGGLADKNADAWKTLHFLGGGVYDNTIPAIVNQLVLRGEFLTCYTPYQPEISQGTLQAIFEFQTMIARIAGMPVSNASMYDGATATAEAALMAQRLSPKGRQNVLVAESLTPEYRKVTETFLKGHAAGGIGVRWNAEGSLDLAHLEEQIKAHNPCALIVGSPNYFGIIEPLDKIKALLPQGCLMLVSAADPSAYSIFESPGALGADAVVGEAHQFGTPMVFGGPHVGFFATKKEFLRQMPGRLCGETVDSRNQRAYTLTLSTREQHIRREKATSNICTNQGLIALRTVIYLSFLGKKGFQTLGETNFSNFGYLANALTDKGVGLKFKNQLHYREGVFEVPNLEKRFNYCLSKNIVPGIRLNHLGMENGLLICVHPKHSKANLDQLVEVLSHEL
jgi:glycine dehydrogenase subunit 1